MRQIRRLNINNNASALEERGKTPKKVGHVIPEAGANNPLKSLIERFHGKLAGSESADHNSMTDQFHPAH